MLSTYDAQDGAVIGKHRVTYTPPEGDEEEGEEVEVEEGSAEERQQNLEERQKRRQPGAGSCVQKGELIVEVTEDGENDFTIELVPAGRARAEEEDPAD